MLVRASVSSAVVFKVFRYVMFRDDHGKKNKHISTRANSLAMKTGKVKKSHGQQK